MPIVMGWRSPPRSRVEANRKSDHDHRNAKSDTVTTELRLTGTTMDRIPVVSAGISARINLFGYAVLETYYAKPFQRPDHKPLFGFQLAPGW